MRHPVRGQHCEVIRMEPVRVADLHRVAPALRGLREKGVEIRDEVPSVLILARLEMGKLEDERPDLVAHRLEPAQETHLEQLRTEKEIVPLPSARTKGRHLRKGPDRDLVRHLEGKDKVPRHLRGDPREEALPRQRVVGRIDADRAKGRPILLQTGGRKAFLREMRAPEIAVLVIEQPAPTRVAPRRRAQENPVLLPESPDKTPDVAAFEEHAPLL
jgi:hypothetical protein